MRVQPIRQRINAGLLITLFCLAAALFLQACDDDNRGAEEGRSGGMVMTTETPTTAGASDAAAVDAAATATPTTPPEPTPTPEPTPVPLAVGQVMTGTVQVRLHASASSSSPVLEVYEPGATFVVMDSDDDAADYPVVIAGGAWYRVRAADGLAGWVRADSFGAE